MLVYKYIDVHSCHHLLNRMNELYSFSNYLVSGQHSAHLANVMVIRSAPCAQSPAPALILHSRGILESRSAIFIRKMRFAFVYFRLLFVYLFVFLFVVVYLFVVVVIVFAVFIIFLRSRTPFSPHLQIILYV